MLKRVSIHQPEHLPWLGFFHKVMSVDEFVILDNVQFEKNYFQNRTKIRTKEGWQYITVPLKKFHSTQKISEIEISHNHTWEWHNLNKIQNSYRRANYFPSYFTDFQKIYSEKVAMLCDFNITLIDFLLKMFEIPTKIILASDLTSHPEATGTARLIDICKTLNADVYLSGQFGKEYLDLSEFEKEKIQVEFQEFGYPEYKQQYQPFIPVSAIDLLFNCGEQSKKIIQDCVKK